MMGYTVSAVQISANRRTAFLLAQALRTKHHLVPVEVIAEEGAGSIMLVADQQEVESTPTYATPHTGPDEELQESTREHYGY